CAARTPTARRRSRGSWRTRARPRSGTSASSSQNPPGNPRFLPPGDQGSSGSGRDLCNPVAAGLLPLPGLVGIRGQHERSTTMKKLVIIGTALVALGGPLAQSAGAMPADVTPVVQQQSPVRAMTPAEQRALILRSEGLNQKYHLGAYKTGMTPAEYRALQ